MDENVMLLFVCVATAPSTGHVVKAHRLVGIIVCCCCLLDIFKIEMLCNAINYAKHLILHEYTINKFF